MTDHAEPTPTATPTTTPAATPQTAAAEDTEDAPATPSPFATFFRRLGPAGPLAVFAATFPPLGGFVLIGLISRIAPWLRAHPAEGLVLYVGGFSALAALSLLPTYACAILGGWTFGFAVGFPASMAAFVLSGLGAYAIAARAAGDRVVEIVREHPRWEAVRVALLDCGFWKAFWIVTLVRLPPTSPFAAANFVMGTTRAPLIPYLLGTFVGMAPRTGVVVWAAAHASTLDFAQARNVWSYVIVVVVTLAVVAIIGKYANDAVRHATR
jgi:uncharacterized membrane protein YdjX (TVP38/TMEM64 family)